MNIRSRVLIHRELAIFLIVGSLTVLTDFLTYRSLLWSGLLEVNTAKAVGFLTGTLFAYIANRLWTFGHKKHAAGSLFRFAILYAVTLEMNVTINSAILQLLHSKSWGFQVAFLIATAISAMLNFIGMKWFAFKEDI